MITRDVYAKARDMRSRGIPAAEVSRSLGISRSAAYQIGQGVYPLARRERAGHESADRDEHCRQVCASECARRDKGFCLPSATATCEGSRAQHLPAEQQRTLNTNLGDLLPLRLANYLEMRDIRSLHDVLQRTCEQLLTLPGIGMRSLALILAVLDRHGFDTSKAWRFLEQQPTSTTE